MSTETQCSWCEMESGNLRPGSHGICERHRNLMLAPYMADYQRGIANDLTHRAEADLGLQNAIELYRVNTPNDDLNEPLTPPESEETNGHRLDQVCFSAVVIAGCLVCAVLLLLGWFYGRGLAWLELWSLTH